MASTDRCITQFAQTAPSHNFPPHGEEIICIMASRLYGSKSSDAQGDNAAACGHTARSGGNTATDIVMFGHETKYSYTRRTSKEK